MVVWDGWSKIFQLWVFLEVRKSVWRSTRSRWEDVGVFRFLGEPLAFII